MGVRGLASTLTREAWTEKKSCQRKGCDLTSKYIDEHL